MKGILGKALLTAHLVAATSAAMAEPIVLSAGDFADSATLVDFNLLGNWQPLDDQYASSNVSFSGALFGLTNPGDTSLFDGSVIASNWMYWPGPGVMGSTWQASFGSAVTMVGFLAETNRADPVRIEAFAGSASRGALTYLNANGYIPDFLGFGDTAGFDRIVVTTANVHNGFFAMDDFRFGGTALTQPGPAVVPEPGSVWLVTLGLLLLGRLRYGLPVACRRRPGCRQSIQWPGFRSEAQS